MAKTCDEKISEGKERICHAGQWQGKKMREVEMQGQRVARHWKSTVLMSRGKAMRSGAKAWI